MFLETKFPFLETNLKSYMNHGHLCTYAPTELIKKVYLLYYYSSYISYFCLRFYCFDYILIVIVFVLIPILFEVGVASLPLAYLFACCDHTSANLCSHIVLYTIISLVLPFSQTQDLPLNMIITSHIILQHKKRQSYIGKQ